MANTFWNVIRITFWGTLEFIWLLLYLSFVLIPGSIIIAFRRLHIKNKVQRQMVKNGMPRDKAKIYAKKYKSFLVGYGSFRGLFRLSRTGIRLGKENKKESEISIQETSESNNPHSYTFIS